MNTVTSTFDLTGSPKNTNYRCFIVLNVQSKNVKLILQECSERPRKCPGSTPPQQIY